MYGEACGLLLALFLLRRCERRDRSACRRAGAVARKRGQELRLVRCAERADVCNALRVVQLALRLFALRLVSTRRGEWQGEQGGIRRCMAGQVDKVKSGAHTARTPWGTSRQARGWPRGAEW